MGLLRSLRMHYNTFVPRPLQGYLGRSATTSCSNRCHDWVFEKWWGRISAISAALLVVFWVCVPEGGVGCYLNTPFLVKVEERLLLKVRMKLELMDLTRLSVSIT